MICVNIASLTGQSYIWNSLPNHVVLADSTNSFKSRLDIYWKKQQSIFNFQSEITGIGSRSQISSSRLGNTSGVAELIQTVTILSAGVAGVVFLYTHNMSIGHTVIEAYA